MGRFPLSDGRPPSHRGPGAQRRRLQSRVRAHMARRFQSTNWIAAGCTESIFRRHLRSGTMGHTRPRRTRRDLRTPRWTGRRRSDDRQHPHAHGPRTATPPAASSGFGAPRSLGPQLAGQGRNSSQQKPLPVTAQVVDANACPNSRQVARTPLDDDRYPASGWRSRSLSASAGVAAVHATTHQVKRPPCHPRQWSSNRRKQPRLLLPPPRVRADGPRLRTQSGR